MRANMISNIVGELFDNSPILCYNKYSNEEGV